MPTLIFKSVNGEDLSGVRAGSMADVQGIIGEIKYLVKDWIPLGMVTMAVGQPGDGKSAFVMGGVVRPIIMATSWFNGSNGPSKPGYVLWCSTENDMAINCKRIVDWGLPLERIKVPFEDDPLRSVVLTSEDDIEQIRRVILKYRIKLVVIDSLRGSHDGDENSSQVSRVLQRITKVAEETKCAILIVHHTRKLNLDEELTANSSRGSNAIIAMVRSQLGIDRPDKSSEWRRVVMLKENLGLRPKPIGFRISNTGVEFGQAPNRPPKEKSTKRDKAEDWLKANMKPGKWHRASQLLQSASKDGFSASAIQLARQAMGITTEDGNVRKMPDKTSEWRLPGEMKKQPTGV